MKCWNEKKIINLPHWYHTVLPAVLRWVPVLWNYEAWNQKCYKKFNHISLACVAGVIETMVNIINVREAVSKSFSRAPNRLNNYWMRFKFPLDLMGKLAGQSLNTLKSWYTAGAQNKICSFSQMDLTRSFVPSVVKVTLVMYANKNS